MTYMIDARLDRGAPSLTLIDPVTGEERFHWRGDNSATGERNWQSLFKRLFLLSCADRLGLLQRAKSPHFGDECIECATCVDQDALIETQGFIFSTETENTDAKNSAVSLLKLQR